MKNQSTPVHQTIWVKDTTLARELDVCRQTIWKWAKQGRIPQPVKLTPGCTRWNLGEVKQELGL